MPELYASNLNPLFSMVAKLKTSDILKLWEETEKQIISVDLANVRDAIMIVLESRHNKEFNDWMGADYPNDNINLYFSRFSI